MNGTTPDDIIQLGKNIRRFRKALGMNQADLALKADTQVTTISLLENGLNRNPGWDLLQRLADALNTTVHELALPPSSSVHINRVPQTLPQGLVRLIDQQDMLLAPQENRISFEESSWLAHVPENIAGNLSHDDFLILLRELRHLSSR